MKNLFLTSGLAILLVGSAFADPYDINNDQNHTLLNDPNNGTASCQHPTLGSYTGPTTFYAKWDSNISGAITLDSSIRVNNVHSSTPKYNASVPTDGISPATPTPLYSSYEVGLYESSTDAAAGGATGKVDDITAPSRTGYEFGGFYTDDNTKVIDQYGVVLPAALTQITTSNTPATWYAHWGPRQEKLDYTCGYVPTGSPTGTVGDAIGGTSPGTSLQLTYDESFTLASSAPNCSGLTGYHFTGWDCEIDIYNPSGDGVYAGTQDSNNPNLFTVSKTGLIKNLEGEHSGHILCDAMWNPDTYTITYDRGSTTCEDTVTGNSPVSQNFTYTSTTGTLTQNGYSVVGHTFNGWKSNKKLETVAGVCSDNDCNYANGATITYLYPGNATLTAQWAPITSGEITLNANKYNSTTPTSVDYSVTTPGSLQTVYGTSVSPYAAAQRQEPINSITPPTLLGYSFGGFYTEKNGGGTLVVNSDGSFINCVTTRQVSTAGGNDEWFAKWTAQENKLSYYCGKVPAGASTGTPGANIQPLGVEGTDYGSDGSIINNFATFDVTYTMPTDPASKCAVLDGYHFAGWSCDHGVYSNTSNTTEYLGTAADSNSPNVITVSQTGAFKGVYMSGSGLTNIRCEAIWSPNTVKTNWLPNGGTLTDAGGANCTYDSTIGIPATIPTRTGYSFDGWTTVAPGSNNNNNNGGGSGSGGNNGGTPYVSNPQQ
jgi:hypothetical protein